jgi:site-specific DNA recombinase
MGSSTSLCRELNAQGFRTKPRRSRSGALNAGYPFNKATLYKILHNRIYLGEIGHKDQWYPGEHPALIDRGLWDRVHAILALHRTQRPSLLKHQTPAPLRGLLFGPDGLAMTPTHTRKGDRYYRYYVTHTANKHSHQDCPVRMVRSGPATSRASCSIRSRPYAVTPGLSCSSAYRHIYQ